ncbi:MAG: B12-binding domain-containing radical SAM protein [Kiritimatiellae bacterium]|nr:B12-binding domain-containing radical SAM protein [Kiritimatiellia bacterium]
MALDFLLIDSQIQTAKDISHLHGKFVPYGLSILYNSLTEAGFSGQLILDDNEYNNVLNTSSDELKSIKLIGIGATTITRFDAKQKIRSCRKRFPGSLIVAGGPHFGNCAEDAINSIPELDIVVRGEADEVIVDLVKLSLGQKKITEISGVTYRSSSGAVISQGPKIVVDTLPSIRFVEKFFSKESFDANTLSPFNPLPSMNMLVGRGCPYACIFCGVNKIKNRTYSITEIVDLIEKTTRAYGIKGVKFYDDSMTINEKFVRELCYEILKRKIEIYWFCDSRANIDLDLLQLMHKAGCRFIAVGLESGSPKIQRIIKKYITNEQVVEFAETCRKVGIQVYVFLMGSFPDETPEDLSMTVDIARKLSQINKAIAGGFGATVILPETELETIAKEKGILPKEFSWFSEYYEPDNVNYDVSPIMPLYKEHITAEMYRQAKADMWANYAASLSLNRFIKNSIENLLRRDLTLKDKVSVGLKVFKSKYL